jgi:hypothetical protein
MGRFRRSWGHLKLGDDTGVFGADAPAAAFAPKRAPWPLTPPSGGGGQMTDPAASDSVRP